MNDFESDLEARLEALRRQGLYRELRRVDSPQGTQVEFAGRTLLNFSSNDYLGLANHPELKAAAHAALERFGTGAGASRLICGSLAPHHELEEMLAAFKGSEAALSFATGYAAAQGAIYALLGPDDVIVVDKLVHACIVDAARLCGARLRVFPHNDLNRLEAILKAPRGAGPRFARSGPADRDRVLVVTESVFSMDGDLAPLRELVELKQRYGAWLMVDEAHATGLYGAHRRGLAEELGVSDRIEVQMGTLGKALGAAGGYLCGSRRLIDLLINRARSFIFSTAPVPAAAAAAAAGLRLAQSPLGGKRRQALWQRLAELASGLRPLNRSLREWRGDTPEERTARGVWSAADSAALGSDVAAVTESGGIRRTPKASRHPGSPESPKPLGFDADSPPPSAIVPLIIGDETKAVAVADGLRARGLLVPAIRYPTVARGRARLRLTLSAAHTSQDVQRLLGGLSRVFEDSRGNFSLSPRLQPGFGREKGQ